MYDEKNKEVLPPKEVLPLNTEIRAQLGGSYIELSNGFVHYELEGSKTSPLVILIHGISAPFIVWDHLYPALVEAGFCVLRYDLYGRGLSDRPQIRYDLTLFHTQLLELLSQLELWGYPMTLIGLSMGGLITADFAVRHAEYIKSIILIDPAGFHTPKPFAPRILHIPFLNRYVMKKMGGARLIKHVLDDFFHPEKFSNYLGQYMAQMTYYGFLDAILSSLLTVPLRNGESLYRAVTAQNIKTMLIWGENDKVIPYESSKIARTILFQAEFHTIPESGHMPQYERSDLVNPLIVTFLKANHKQY